HPLSRILEQREQRKQEEDDDDPEREIPQIGVHAFRPLCPGPAARIVMLVMKKAAVSEPWPGRVHPARKKWPIHVRTPHISSAVKSPARGAGRRPSPILSHSTAFSPPRPRQLGLWLRSCDHAGPCSTAAAPVRSGAARG